MCCLHFYRKAEINSHSGYGTNDNHSKNSSDIFGDFNPYGSSSSINNANNIGSTQKPSNNITKSPSMSGAPSRSPYNSKPPAQNSTKDLTSTLMDSNLHQMHSQPPSRMTTSMSMPMAMGVASVSPQSQPQQATMMNSYFPGANNNPNSFSNFGVSNVPRSRTVFNMNASSGSSMGMMNPRMPSMNHHQPHPDSNMKILSKQDIDEFLR